MKVQWQVNNSKNAPILSILELRDRCLECKSRDYRLREATEIVSNYLDQKPEKRNEPGYVLVRRALAEIPL